MTQPSDLTGLTAPPRQHTPVSHPCDHCGSPWGSFGFRLSSTRVAHYCREHRDEGERRLPQNVARRAA